MTQLRHPRLYGLTAAPRTIAAAQLDTVEALARDARSGRLALLQRAGLDIASARCTPRTHRAPPVPVTTPATAAPVNPTAITHAQQLTKNRARAPHYSQV